jgi:hypothetical protein
MATFMQYAAITTDEALQDANWYPEDPKDQEMTVCAISTFNVSNRRLLQIQRVSVLGPESALSKMSTIPVWPLQSM